MERKIIKIVPTEILSLYNQPAAWTLDLVIAVDSTPCGCFTEYVLGSESINLAFICSDITLNVGSTCSLG